MSKKQVTKNLKHGYIFLVGTILVLFLVSLGTEIYLNGGFNLNKPQKETEEEIEQPDPNYKLEIENLEDGYKTKDKNITVVGSSEKTAIVFVNTKKIEISSEGRFEAKVGLVVGKNEILVQAFEGDEKKREIKLEVFREEEPKQEEQQETDGGNSSSGGGSTNTPTQSSPTLKPDPRPTPTPTPEPEPSPLTGLKMSCSINNTYPSVGQKVTITCTVKDQNGSPVSGAFGYVSVNWQSGTSVYTLSQSNSSGSMSVSFNVPSGNSGAISGNIKASKSGLNVNSNFTLNIQ